MERSRDWIRQAERDLKAAEVELENEIFEWCCFLAQQAAEKAVKAICEKFKIECWGHSVSKILQRIIKETEIEISEEIFTCAKILDRYYIPTRYPNGFEEGAPMDYYTKKDAKEAIEYARKIIDFCKRIIQG